MKYTKITALFLSSLFLLPACSKDKGLIIEKTQQTLEDKPIAVEGYEYLNGVGSWLEAETEYKSYPTENITNLLDSFFTSIGSNIYFQLQKAESMEDETGYYYTSGKAVYAYISRQTGEKHFLCPDPLCTHGAYSGCQYLNMYGVVPDTNGKIYSSRQNMNMSTDVLYDNIYEIDTNAGTITAIYTPNLDEENLVWRMTTPKLVKDGKLYYHCKSIYEQLNEDGESEQLVTQKLMMLDLETRTSEPISSDSFNNVYIIAQLWDKWLVSDIDEHILFVTDMNFENRQNFDIQIEDDYSMPDAYFDENTEELYILYTHSIEDDSNFTGENVQGCLYRIKKDLSVEQIPMPSENITSVQITEKYIYYTVFDPTYYGSRNGHVVYDGNGGKIYRTSRNDTTTGELFFDGRGDLLFKGGYYVDGENIYLKYYRTKGSGDNVGFQYTGSIARVNVENNTLAWINLY